MKPAPPVTRIGESVMAVITIQQVRQTGTPGARLDAEGIEDFLAGQHAMLRLVRRIGAVGVCNRGNALEGELPVMSRLGVNRLAHDQRRRSLVTAVMVGAPKRRAAIELLEHGENHPRRILYRSGIAAPIVGQKEFFVLFET